MDPNLGIQIRIPDSMLLGSYFEMGFLRLEGRRVLNKRFNWNLSKSRISRLPKIHYNLGHRRNIIWE